MCPKPTTPPPEIPALEQLAFSWNLSPWLKRKASWQRLLSCHYFCSFLFNHKMILLCPPSYLISQQLYGTSLVFPILWMRKLRYREIKAAEITDLRNGKARPVLSGPMLLPLTQNVKLPAWTSQEKSLNRNQETCHVTGLVTVILTFDFLIISL